jgi:hypothetical protein
MTDPTIGVGEAAARAPRLEHADVLLIERELDELERRCADANDPHPLMTRLWAGKAIQQLRAARAPREPLEPQLRAAVAELCVAVRGSGDMPYSWFPAIAKLLALEDEGALAAARSALPPPQTSEEKEDARVAPFNPRVETTGSTASKSPGNATMCLAEEWQRDGRGLWAMRACRYYEKHGKPHDFGSWRYNVQPPAALPRAPEPDLLVLVESTAARLESEMVPCPRCTGKGYHHGFGEGGHDPDWCENCGGPGEVGQDPKVILREAFEAVRATRAGAEAPPPEEP